MATPERIFPFSVGGAALAAALPNGLVTLTDLTGRPRFGLKGSGSSTWLQAQGVSIPAVNRIVMFRNMRVLRLGYEDFVLLAERSGEELADLLAAWHTEAGPRGYESWRDEGWAWMRLSGPQVATAMAQLCAIDLRPERFADNEIAQTRVGGIEAVLFRSGAGFDLLFDITMSAHFARVVTATAKYCELTAVHNLEKE
jgi:sarcosine oxidase, subunit gamma